MELRRKKDIYEKVLHGKFFLKKVINGHITPLCFPVDAIITVSIIVAVVNAVVYDEMERILICIQL
jgi:hypothetical protein